LLQLVDSELVDEHLDPRARPVWRTSPGGRDPEHGLGELQVLAVVELDELVQAGATRGMIEVHRRRASPRRGRAATVDPFVHARKGCSWMPRDRARAGPSNAV